MSEEEIDLVLSWSGEGPGPGGTANGPAWVNVAEKIDLAFKSGGSVNLEFGKFEVVSFGHLGCRRAWLRDEAIGMESEPGIFRVFVCLRENEGKHPFRQLWQPGAAEPRDTVTIWDDEMDPRQVCTDVEVAKTLFREFFESRKVTQYIIDNTRE